MRQSKRLAGVLGFLLSIMSLAIVAAQQPRDAGRPVGADVTGRVLDGTGQPLAGATVRLSNWSTWSATATSDEDGHFRFTGVPAGRFVVKAEKRGYLQDSSAGDQRPADTATLEIQPGARLEPVTLPLRRGGTIAGRLLRPDGGPAANVPMMLSARRGLSGDPASTAREDVSDVTIRLARPGRLSGRVEFTSTGRRVPDPRRVRLSVTREGYKPAVVPVALDGTFVQDSFPGRYTISAFVVDDNQVHWTLLSAQAGGIDLPGHGFVLEPGSMSVPDVVLTLSDDVRR